MILETEVFDPNTCTSKLTKFKKGNIEMGCLRECMVDAWGDMHRE